MSKIYSVSCPKCKEKTPIATKTKERLREIEIDCPKCQWKGLASEGIIQEKEFSDWF